MKSAVDAAENHIVHILYTLYIHDNNIHIHVHVHVYVNNIVE